MRGLVGHQRASAHRPRFLPVSEALERRQCVRGACERHAEVPGCNARHGRVADVHHPVHRHEERHARDGERRPARRQAHVRDALAGAGVQARADDGAARVCCQPDGQCIIGWQHETAVRRQLPHERREGLEQALAIRVEVRVVVEHVGHQHELRRVVQELG